MTDPDGRITNYTYDKRGLLANLTDGTDVFAFTYDADGRRTALAYPNGVAASYDYDSLGQVTDIVNALNGNPVAYNSYTYDALGNRLTNTDMYGTNTYSYDVYQQLAKALHPAQPEEDYTYDGVGNRLNGSGLAYTYTSGNRMLTRDSAHYSYDANGNTISKTDASGVTAYQYDFENRLVKVTLPNNVVAAYKYDALGRRIEKNVSGVVTRYLYDGYNILAEYDDAGNVKARYTHNLAIDDPLAMERGGSVYYYHKDALGSVTALTDASGQVAQTYEYDSFGNITNRSGNVENPYTYTGREYDTETGLYYYRARYFDPRAGRFINEDPIGFAGGPNKYIYANNDPVYFTDPSGRFLSPVIIVIGLGIPLIIYEIEQAYDYLHPDIPPLPQQGPKTPELHNPLSCARCHKEAECQPKQQEPDNELHAPEPEEPYEF